MLILFPKYGPLGAHNSATTLKINIGMVCLRPPKIYSNLPGNEQEASKVALFALGYWKQIFQVG